MKDLNVATTTIEHLDFEHVQPCEHSCHATQHPGDAPATFLVAGQCPNCPRRATYFLCLPGWEFMGQAFIGCSECGAVFKRAECTRILRVIGSPS